MSKEDFHKDLLSRLDPETVQKALERYNRKNSNVGLHNDNESVASGVPSKNLDSLPSTPRYSINVSPFLSIESNISYYNLHFMQNLIIDLGTIKIRSSSQWINTFMQNNMPIHQVHNQREN